MKTVAKSCAALALSICLSGCWSHSFPEADSFIYSAGAQTPARDAAEVFVDANGTFYPSNWRQHMNASRSWKADSLLNESDDDPTFRQLIEADEVRQLNEIAAFGRDKKRIFILVHGYNNTVADTKEPYGVIESKLDRREGDGVLRFHWDGLTGSGIGGGKIWFNATGYSQLAGSRGLRRILDQFEHKDIYLIGHSRGASVMLSAFANPIYNPRFLASTKAVAGSWKGDYANLLSPAPLAERGNRIHVLLLAPAVDRIDFCDASQQPTESGPYTCNKFKPLGQQVKSFRYSVNSKDPVLRKFVGLSDSFNPTGLGLQPEVGRQLRAEHYPILQEYVFEQPDTFHLFRRYTEDPVFDRMLADAGIAKTN